MNLQRLLKQDWILTICTTILLVVGAITIYSATYTAETVADGKGTINRQMVFILLGLLVYLLVMSIDYTWYRYFSILGSIYLVIILLLLYVWLLGDPVRNTNRWIEFGFIRIQPSEYAKVLLIMINSALLSSKLIKLNLPAINKNKLLKNVNSLYDRLTQLAPVFTIYILALIISLLPIGLVLVQPALGNAIIGLLLCLLIFFISFPGKDKIISFTMISLLTANVLGGFLNWDILYKMFGVFLHVGKMDLVFFIICFLLILLMLSYSRLRIYLIILAILVGGSLEFAGKYTWENVMTDYQQKRVSTFLDPTEDPQGAGWQVIQSKIAIGSGRLFGLGFLQGTQSKLNYLPEAYNDFIFAAFAEEFGFVGSLILLSIYIVLIVRIVQIGLNSGNTFAMYLCHGTAIMFILHVMINIGMNIGIMPVTGIPLPLMSYGGSSVMVNMISLGIVQSVFTHIKPIDTRSSLMLRS